jgi:hypothetical protein
MALHDIGQADEVVRRAARDPEDFLAERLEGAQARILESILLMEPRKNLAKREPDLGLHRPLLAKDSKNLPPKAGAVPGRRFADSRVPRPRGDGFQIQRQERPP